MKVIIFHGGALGGAQAQIANTFSGAQDMFMVPPVLMASYAPEANVISLPYVFNSVEHLQKFYMSDLWKPAIEKTAAQGAIFLDEDWTWFQYDPRGFIATRPIFTPTDLNGLKMRVWEAKTVIETWKGFGATPVVVPRPEMYLAFKQKIIEGGPETVGVAYAQKNMEMAKYWIRSEEFYPCLSGYHPHPLYVVCLLGLQARAGAGALIPAIRLILDFSENRTGV